MNGFLIDTNVISEYTRPVPDPSVMEWFRIADPNRLFVSAITVGEIRLGIENLPDGRRRSELENWLATGLPQWFAPNILPISQSVADRWGRLTILAKKNGTPLTVPDGLIAATAVEHQLTLVTRNTKDFACLPLQMLNPWTS